ncbi:hypothetical protein D1BOALGB6SA_5935 [Olavius sp. associated proteobacterium Delta 1]|nr:hypothetical protein D1BOALGB6SA_5935 [Olavius sp. associated proteobacterium Delta 1]
MVTHIPNKGESAGGGVRYGVYPPGQYPILNSFDKLLMVKKIKKDSP